MKFNLRAIHTFLFIAVTASWANAQQFYNLTSEAVRVDSTVPYFSHTESLPSGYRDSIYTFEIVYPEYADMPRADIDNYRRLKEVLPPETPTVDTHVVMDRKCASLLTTFCPVVYRDGKYQVLASFMLRRNAMPRKENGTDGDIVSRIRHLNSPFHAEQLAAESTAPADRYAAHSVLRSGRWAKIRVPANGIYQLTDAVIRQAGFSDPSKVKIYGYGGNLQNEVLTAQDLIDCDDLHELPTFRINGKRLFYGCGPVYWEPAQYIRTRNPYSDYGYYFLTASDSEPIYADSTSFLAQIPANFGQNDLYEVDGYSYSPLGRNLFDTREVAVGDSMVIEFDSSDMGIDNKSTATVAITSSGATSVEVSHNGQTMRDIITTTVKSPSYNKGFRTVKNMTQTVARSNNGKERIVLRVKSGSPMRLDFVSLRWDSPHPLPDLATTSFPAPEYVYGITNQDHHADPQADMVIIIPTSQKLREQAERVKAFHEERDSMRVNLVPADELYNEFSSGTPDASAYRHYLKMLYDRASTEDDQPKYLVLFGASVWDNRMKTSECRQYSPDDFLLAYESEESFDKRYSYVDDGFYCMLDDGEGAKPLSTDKLDVASGRFPVATVTDAKTMVDKLLSYSDYSSRGSWLNTIFFMGDDGDNNTHMAGSNRVADQVIAAHPGYMVKKVMWDAYQRVSSASGNTYPEVTRAIKQQQKQGALIMDYVGHGSEWQFSHENVLHISDFQTFSNKNLPLWATFGCDFMPFDALTDNIGMKAVLNANGGAVALFGSTRTVFSSYNDVLHSAFMRHVLTYDTKGLPLPVGEAIRRAKNEATGSDLAANSVQFTLLGDPAMRLNLPTANIVIDSISGVDVTSEDGTAQMKAGAVATVKGHIEGMPDFSGEVTMCVRDNKETIVCRNNDGNAKDNFTYTDRTKTIYTGRNNVRDGKFEFEFAVPKDINYSGETGLINAWAVCDDKTVIAQGYSDRFTVGDSQIAANDSIGPSIFCYLNTPSFQNGGTVNTTPYFVAEVKDRDGINASGTGIGHDLQLCIDGKAELTYSLNDNFEFDFGSYTSGTTYYNIPELSEGEHRLQFRAWDIQNNASTAELRFNVAKGQKPWVQISCTDNPAKESTSFIVGHDRSGSQVDVTMEVFDMSGRMLWSNTETGVSETSPYVLAWDLTASNGSRLQPGVYLYRAKLTSDGATRTTKAKKLIVVGNK